MAWTSNRLVLVESDPGDERELLGTGFIVARDRVLTAWHVVDGKPRLRVSAAWDRQGPSAEVVWRAPEADVVLLAADLGPQPQGHPLALLDGRPMGGEKAWEAFGYPAVRAASPSCELEQVGGRTLSYLPAVGKLRLDVRTNPNVWGGLSGGPVVVTGRVVGVVRAEPKGWDGKRIEATPVLAFLDDADFRREIGLGARDDKLRADLEALTREVVALLERHSRLAAELRGALELDPSAGADTIAQALLTRDADRVTCALNYADDALAGSASADARTAASDLLWRLLPYVVDWRALVILGRDALDGEGAELELPVRNAAVAEAVLAGVDGRRCRFVPKSKPLRGQGQVPTPPTPVAPVFDEDAGKFADSVVDHLRKKLELSDQDDLEAHVFHRAKRAAPGDRLPYYLLLGDDTAWKLALGPLRREVPSLRLVRLTGDRLRAETLLELTLSDFLARDPGDPH